MVNENIVEESVKPVFKIKVGSIDVAVWSREKDGKEFFTVSYAKTYLDSNREWQKTNNLMVSDVPNLQIALQKAYEFAKIKN